jgi:hypothetical protein
MADNTNSVENEAEVVIYNDDPMLNIPLTRLENTVREYKARHDNETGQAKDKAFEEYKAGLPKADMDKLPDMEDINEWVWDIAKPEELIAFMAIAKELVSDVGFVIQRYYVGGKSNAAKGLTVNSESLSDHRKRVVKAILNLIELCGSDIFPGLTEDMIRALPSVEFKNRVDDNGNEKDGEEYIILPRAPKSPSDKPKSDGPKPLRANNTKTMVTVNGEVYIPVGNTEYGQKLGGACKELFNKSVQDCAKLYFNNWLDKNNPALYTAPDGTVYGLKTFD